MAPPDFSTSLHKYWFYFSVAYASYKVLSAISNVSESEHKDLKDESRLRKPNAHISPQFFVNEKGLWIYHRDWILPQQVSNHGLNQPKGVVIICHGLAEHIGRYEHFAQKLNSNGFACYGMDHQGHGQSEGDRCYVKNFNDYVEDILLFSERIRLEYNNTNNSSNKENDPKLFLFGHSMGGLIAAFAAYKAQSKYSINNNNNDNSNNRNNNSESKSDDDSNSNNSVNSMEGPLYDGGIIFSSPAFGVAPEQDLPPTVKSFAWQLARVLPKMPLLELNNDALSHDATILYRLKKDKLHFQGKVPLQTAKELIRHMQLLEDLNKKGEITYPFLIYGGTNDKLTYPGSWEVFFNNSAAKDKTYEIFDGLYHETLNETENEQKRVFNMVLKWMLKRTGDEKGASRLA